MNWRLSKKAIISIHVLSLIIFIVGLIMNNYMSSKVAGVCFQVDNKGPDKWGEFFNEDSSLLCSLDRIFDVATVFMIKGNSYRGKNCETISLSAGDPVSLIKTKS